MEVRQGRLRGITVIEPAAHVDARGFLVETYSRSGFDAVGIRTEFVREVQTRSVAGVIRGMHFEIRPGQTKLVRVASGRILDVVVDIRRGSSTFGQHEVFDLDDERHRQLLIPPGFAHGFCVLSDEADVCYALSASYDAAVERGIRWNDTDLAIPWPVTAPVISQRDRTLPRLRDVEADLLDW